MQGRRLGPLIFIAAVGGGGGACSLVWPASFAGADDAGSLDGGVDAVPPDSGPVDAGLVDAGLVDAGLVDAGLVDAGLVDAGLIDGGVDPGVVITAVDGDGSERPVSVADAPAGLPARHRVRDVLVVAGERLDTVFAARLQGEDGVAHALEVLPMDSLDRRGFRLPDSIAPGLFTLVLATAGAEASAQVFLLQGEPGPPGPPTRVSLEPATTAECRFGGRAIVTSAGDATGERAVTCDAAVMQPTTIAIVDGADLLTTLGALRERALAAPVVLQLPEAMTFAAPITAGHPDGRWLRLRGPCTITAPAGGFAVADELHIEDVVLLAGETPVNGAVGVSALSGSRVHVTDVQIAGFTQGLFTNQADVEVVRGVFVNNNFSLTATRGSRVVALAVSIDGSERAVASTLGSFLNVRGLQATNVATGVFASIGGFVDAGDARIVASDFSIDADTNSTVRFVNASLVGAVSLTDGAAAFVSNANAQVGTLAVELERGALLNWFAPAGAAGAVTMSGNSAALIPAGVACTATTSSTCEVR